MTGPRDLSAEWAAVFGAAYVREHYDYHRLTGEHPLDDEECDRLAEDAATIADQAIAALHRVRGDQALAAREHVRLARDVEARPVPRGHLADRRRYQRDAWAAAAGCLLAWLLGSGGER